MAILGSVELAEFKQTSKVPIDAKLRMDLAPQPLTVLADASQIRQALLNLVTNASDSLGGHSGSVTISTGTTTDAVLLPPHPNRRSTDYVFLTISDTGAGMDAATKERTFEPFFTTTFTGRGLGLSMTLGIVRAHDGHITVDTNAGHGTRVTVVFPAVVASIPQVDSAPPTDWNTWRGHGTILLADDEESVRLVTREMLQRAGIDVIEATNGAEAIAQFRNHKDRIRLMLLDVTMPEMSGVELFAQAQTIAPATPALFISGYTELNADETALPPRATFLRKPFTAQRLIEAIRRALDAGGGRSPAAD